MLFSFWGRKLCIIRQPRAWVTKFVWGLQSSLFRHLEGHKMTLCSLILPVSGGHRLFHELCQQKRLVHTARFLCHPETALPWKAETQSNTNLSCFLSAARKDGCISCFFYDRFLHPCYCVVQNYGRPAKDVPLLLRKEPSSGGK